MAAPCSRFKKKRKDMKSEFHNRLSLSRQTGGGCPLPPHPYEETIKAIIGTTTTLNTGINLLEGEEDTFAMSHDASQAQMPEAAGSSPLCSTPKLAHGHDSLQCGWTGGATIHNISLPLWNSQTDNPFCQVTIDLDQADEIWQTPCCPTPNSSRSVSATQMARVTPSMSSITSTPSTSKSTASIQMKKKISTKKVKGRRHETPEDRADENDPYSEWLESSLTVNIAKGKWCESEIVKNKAKAELAALQKEHIQLQILCLKESMGLGSPEHHVEIE